MTGTMTIDGATVTFEPGDTIATALARRAASHGLPPPPMFCGIGQCQTCLVRVKDKGTVESCLMPCEDGLVVSLLTIGDGRGGHD